ncbi:PcfB family protein [Butyrivibrio sp. INlla14]|uniref:PcfB family protein n=1 Tax=Butyrivibrio sp. INlla14 TaxID=1520808 RepID=UPI000876A906|nr:PcfB family protein [Butyrivibrio sp. INlla14]SCY63258.1 Protein of unknown function [Butyrivibrio sp. INlla14]
MVNEETSKESIRFVVDKAVKPTVHMLIGILRAFARHLHDEKYFGKGTMGEGKQSVKDLIKQGQGVQAIELEDEGIKGFNRLAKKYGVDYAVVKEKETGHYKIFFKARDIDAIDSVVAAYTARQLKKEKSEKVSVLDKLQKFKNLVKKTPVLDPEKNKEKVL